MIRRSLLTGLIVTIASIASPADDTLDQLKEYLTERELSVHIKVKLLDSNEVMVWTAESTRVTVTGRAINVKLDNGNDVFIDAFINPFGDIDENLVLVVYGEAWIASNTTDGKKEGIKYKSFMQSLPVEPGESIVFFPLGYAVDADTNFYTIQLEIQLYPREDAEEGDTPPQEQ